MRLCGPPQTIEGVNVRPREVVFGRRNRDLRRRQGAYQWNPVYRLDIRQGPLHTYRRPYRTRVLQVAPPPCS